MSVLRVLIADDSPTVRQLMRHLIDATADMRVVGEAHNGQQAIQLTKELRPDVVLMDIVMPKMDGLEATREIMAVAPTPIVMVSAGFDQQETDFAFRALRSGALTVLQKPSGPRDPNFPAQSATLINAVRAMAGVKVIHHYKHYAEGKPVAPLPTKANGQQSPELVAIAVSTGGPAALSDILRALPADFALPIVIVQHISADFLPSLVEWLSGITSLPIAIAAANERPVPGHIYFAPGNAHLMLNRAWRFELSYDLAQTIYIPSGDMLLESVGKSYGTKAVGVVLTGMGNDGAHGLYQMRAAGAYTIAQDEATSVVYGMPREAALMSAACDVLSIHEITAKLISLGVAPRKESSDGHNTHSGHY